MDYQFPTIFNIQQAREAIKGFPEFVEVEKDGYIVFNYLLSKETTFDSHIRRELRGLKFDLDGNVLARPFHKFFNLGERLETLKDQIDWNVPHVIFEKLDGSMVHPLVFPDGVRWSTKMGITEVSMKAEIFVTKNKEYDAFAKTCYNSKITPIFEYVSPDNRIVLPYKEENLILLALRTNNGGNYLHHSTMNWIACEYGIPVVQVYKGNIDDIKDLEHQEGVVVRFNTGHMVKVKTSWYVAIHKAKDRIRFEKDVIQLILNEQIDDVLPDLPKYDQDKIGTYKEQLIKSIDTLENEVYTILNNIGETSRKDFAVTSLDPLIKSICFKFFNDRQNLAGIRREIINIILKNSNTRNNVNSIRKYLNTTWENSND